MPMTAFTLHEAAQFLYSQRTKAISMCTSLRSCETSAGVWSSLSPQFIGSVEKDIKPVMSNLFKLCSFDRRYLDMPKCETWGQPIVLVFDRVFLVDEDGVPCCG